MAITTIDGCIAGFQQQRIVHKAISPTLIAGKPQSTWYLTGIPGPGSAPTASLDGETYSSASSPVSGQIPYVHPVSGNSYLARFLGSVNGGGVVLLCDRLWGNGNIANNTSLQSITSPTWPARDVNGSTNGEGVFLGLEVSAAMGANAPTVTVTYTNSDGTGSRTAGFGFATGASASIGSFFPIALQAGDVGVRSVQSLQYGGTAWASGTAHLIAYRVIAALEAPVALSTNAMDVLTGGMPRTYSGTVPWIVFISGGTSASWQFASIAFTHG